MRAGIDEGEGEAEVDLTEAALRFRLIPRGPDRDEVGLAARSDLERISGQTQNEDKRE